MLESRNHNDALQGKFATLSAEVNVLKRDLGDLQSEVRDGFAQTNNNFTEIKRLLVMTPDQRAATVVSSNNGSLVRRNVSGVGITSFITKEEKY